MNNAILRTLLVMMFFVFLNSCYNNSHVRTQRILEPDDKIISGYASLNFVAEDTDYESYDVRHGGISGMRLGLSYLGVHKGYEQGLTLAYGNGGGDYKSLILGYDLRSVRSSTNYRPYRYGLYAELNQIRPASRQNIQEGSVLQLRPYMMTTTAPGREWYGGIHSVFSFGTIQTREVWSTYSSDFSRYEEFEREFDYDVSSLGVGFTVGNELSFGGLLVQTQLDLTILNQRNEVNADDYASLYADENIHPEIEPLDQTGPVISLGFAVSREPQRERSLNFNPVVSSSPILPFLAHQHEQVFDPLTGEPIITESKPPVLKFDPLTGELLPADNKPKFDPFTGLMVTESVPYSLLKPSERSALLMKRLQITKLNGGIITGTVQDVIDRGLVIFRDSYGHSSLDTLAYEGIKNITFEGGRRGFRKGMSSAITSCGICIALPLSATILTGEGEYFWIGMLASPAVGLGTLLVSALENDTYDIEFMDTPNAMTNIEYRKQILRQLIIIYIETGFPEYDLTKIQNRKNP